MKVRKEPLVEDRIRRLPKEGWSWIDRRFLRQHAETLDRDAILLYLFLAAVSDKHGLSYYGDSSIGSQLYMSTDAVARAREQLERRDLIAFRSPLYQVLSLPRKQAPRDPRRQEATPMVLADVFRMLADRDIAGREAGGGRP